MKPHRLLLCLLAVGAVIANSASWATPRLESNEGGVNFDKLSAEDRKVMQERFAKEIFPLMQRGGKDGCLGCHGGGKGGQALRLTGQVDKDFPKLVKDGFFVPDDPGSLLGRMMEKDPKRRMPPDKKQAWSDKELELMKTFVTDLEKKQKK